MTTPRLTAYQQIIDKLFFRYHKKGRRQFEFPREALFDAAAAAGVSAPKNVGDVVYAFRYRALLPASILATAPAGEHWIIEGVGRSRYRFRLTTQVLVTPTKGLFEIPIPDGTPEIIRRYALTDEQALLAIVRYNRLVDIFTGTTAYPLQSHLRSNIAGVGQIEIDELYLAVSKRGTQYVIPVQAKGAKDRIGVVQTKQDFIFCRDRFPALVTRPLAVQFSGGTVAMFELTVDAADGEVKIVEERHYRLVDAEAITDDLLKSLPDE